MRRITPLKQSISRESADAIIHQAIKFPEHYSIKRSYPGVNNPEYSLIVYQKDRREFIDYPILICRWRDPLCAGGPDAFRAIQLTH